MIPQGSDRPFVPESALRKLLHKAAVRKALEKHTIETDIDSLALFVCDKATRIFAILAWAESESLIEQFYKHQFIDDQLPIRLEENYVEDCVEAISFQFGKISIEKHPFNNDHWTDRTIDDFCNHYQWPFLTPVFYQSQFRYNFHERTRMPFVDKRFRSERGSNFSVVQEWSIHRDHICAPDLIVRAPWIYPSYRNKLTLCSVTRAIPMSIL